MNESQWLIVAGSIGPIVTLSTVVGLVIAARRYIRAVRDSMAQQGEDIAQLKMAANELSERVNKLERKW